MTENTVKKIFIFFICYLPLQYALVGILGYYKSEPWPAFVFPGFKNVYVYDGSYIINSFYIEVKNNEGEGRVLFTPQMFFYEVPNSQVAGFMRQNIDDEDLVAGYSEETRSWFRERATELNRREPGEIHYIHKRNFVQRSGGILSTDSVRVVKRTKIVEGTTR